MVIRRILYRMNKLQLLEQSLQLDRHDRLALAYDLLDSVLNDPEVTPLTHGQRVELRARLAYHRAHPEEAGVTLHEIRRCLFGDDGAAAG